MPFVQFNAYAVCADFEYRLDPEVPASQHVIQSRFESPNPFSARASAIQEIRRIKSFLDQDKPDPEARYQYEGTRLWMEYQIIHPCSEVAPELRKLYLLDGKIGTVDNLLQRLSSEEFLLDVMGYTFIRGIADTNDGKVYSEMVDDLLNGLVELK